jgi:hypothetical protein
MQCSSQIPSILLNCPLNPSFLTPSTTQLQAIFSLYNSLHDTIAKRTGNEQNENFSSILYFFGFCLFAFLLFSFRLLNFMHFNGEHAGLFVQFSQFCFLCQGEIRYKIFKMFFV